MQAPFTSHQACQATAGEAMKRIGDKIAENSPFANGDIPKKKPRPQRFTCA